MVFTILCVKFHPAQMGVIKSVTHYRAQLTPKYMHHNDMLKISSTTCEIHEFSTNLRE